MSIKTIMSIWPASVIFVRSAVLKPAVLGVTDWNRALNSRVPRGSSENSKKKNQAAGAAISTAVVTRITLLCIRYRLKWSRFLFTSSQVRKPMPPTMMSAMIVRLITGWDAYVVREEKGDRIPIRSKPALQKAEMEWNMAYQTPLRKPKSRTNTGAMATAPRSSTRNTVFRINSVIRTMPPTWGAEMDSRMVLRCIRLIFRPEKIATATETVTTPMPPIWIRNRITACPNMDQ